MCVRVYSMYVCKKKKKKDIYIYKYKSSVLPFPLSVCPCVSSSYRFTKRRGHKYKTNDLCCHIFPDYSAQKHSLFFVFVLGGHMSWLSGALPSSTTLEGCSVKKWAKTTLQPPCSPTLTVVIRWRALQEAESPEGAGIAEGAGRER